MKQLINTMKLHKQTPIYILLCMLGAFALGAAIVCAILTFDETAQSWFPLGTLLSLFSLAVFAVVTFLSYQQDFMLALSLGRTRREFMLHYAAEQLVWLLVAYFGLILEAAAESLLYPALFPQFSAEFSIFPMLTNWRIVVPVILTLVIVPMFLGALYGRFGKTFGIILYIVWIGSCLLPPRIINHLDELSPAQQAGVRAVTGWFTALPPAAWFAAGIAAIAAMVTATVHLGMKQSVR